jgi:hypothetical protein
MKSPFSEGPRGQTADEPERAIETTVEGEDGAFP